MKNILAQIIAYKKKEVKELKAAFPQETLLTSPFLYKKCISSKNALLLKNSSGIIAEFKRQSPSKGVINVNADVDKVVDGYQKAGSSVCSVLTDSYFFGAKPDDFAKARKKVKIPLLRKDFIVDEYQVFEAKAIGADLILLIAAVLNKKECEILAKKAQNLGLEVLLEIHHEKELDCLNEYVDLVGVNNRNLQTFTVDIEKSVELVKKIPDNFVKIAESGISRPETINNLRKEGFQGFLIGERFMKTERPGSTCQKFINKLASQ